MAKPRLIILIRHAQSEGNKNREIHQTIPDHRVKLTSEGWQQAYDAGRRLRAMLRADDSIQFYTSPYRRTRETTEGILATLTADDPEPSPFKRNHIKVYEEPRLREQDFGNFQPCSAEMERMWQERADYGHFFYRIPNGESAADAYDRVSGFNESLWRQFSDDDFASVCVLVTHGLMSRVFLMKWYHWPVEYFEDLRNVNHCEFLIMRRQPENDKYLLESKLRTWSELRRERERALQQQQKGKETAKPPAPIVQHRRWGGCPNGCNHDKNFRIRSNLADLVKHDHNATISPSNTIAPDSVKGTNTPVVVNISSPATPDPSSSSLIGRTTGLTSVSSSLTGRRSAARRFQSSDEETEEEGGRNLRSSINKGGSLQIDLRRVREEEVVSSPDSTPSFISLDDRLHMQLTSPAAVGGSSRTMPPLMHIGRDGGGSYSGHNSRTGSDADSSADERAQWQQQQQQRTHYGRPRSRAPTDHNNDDDHQHDGDASEEEAMHAPGQDRCGDDDGDDYNNGGSGSRSVVISPRPTEYTKRQHSGMRHGARANRLGDSPQSSDCEHCAQHPESEGEGRPVQDALAGLDDDNNDDDRQRVIVGTTTTTNTPALAGKQGRKGQEEKGAWGQAEKEGRQRLDYEYDGEMIDLDELEKEDKSIRGSVY